MVSTVCVDTNTAEDELYNGLFSFRGKDDRKLWQGAVYLKRSRLDLGDVCIRGADHTITIERKTWADFAASMSDGRLHEQKKRFLETRGEQDILMYIIEGGLQRISGASRGICNRSLTAWMLKTSIRDNVCVFRTQSTEDTIDVIVYLQGQIEKRTLFENSASSRSHAAALSTTMKRKRKNVEADPLVHMLAAIPGMSIDKARAVASKHPTLSSLCQATEEELADVLVGKRRLGGALAKRLFSTC